MAEVGLVGEVHTENDKRPTEILKDSGKTLYSPSLLKVGGRPIVVCPSHTINEQLSPGLDTSGEVSTVVVADGDSVELFDLFGRGLSTNVKKVSTIPLRHNVTNEIPDDGLPRVGGYHAYIEKRGEDVVLYDRSLEGTGIATVEDLRETQFPQMA